MKTFKSFRVSKTVLKKEIKRNDDLEKKWYKAFREVQKDFYELIKNNYPEVMNWTGTNTNVQAQYEGLLGGKISAPTPAAT